MQQPTTVSSSDSSVSAEPPSMSARMVSRDRAATATGAVIVVDVLRAFSTAAYALDSGAEMIILVDSPQQALALQDDDPNLLLAGEDRGRRLPGFDFANSPAQVAATDLTGRRLVLRTSAGTRGAVAATAAGRLWCAGLATARATAAAVAASGLGAPTYVITGQHPGEPERGQDDREAAAYIDRLLTGRPADPVGTGRRIADSPEAARTLALGPDHVDPTDIELAVRADVFDFAMEAESVDGALRLTAAAGIAR